MQRVGLDDSAGLHQDGGIRTGGKLERNQIMSDRYAEERYNPTFAQCSKLSLHFDGTKLEMKGGSKDYSYPAASGKADNDGKFDYSSARQKLRREGPIPEGTYWIRPDEMWENARYKFWASTDSWGNYRIAIHPFTTTVTHGRGGFFIHGGKVLGSIGCIDLTSHMNSFASDLIREAGPRKCQIHLTVKY